jgi:hypothetical protein
MSVCGSRIQVRIVAYAISAKAVVAPGLGKQCLNWSEAVRYSRRIGPADEDVPFASIVDGVAMNVNVITERGLPSLVD